MGEAVGLLLLATPLPSSITQASRVGAPVRARVAWSTSSRPLREGLLRFILQGWVQSLLGKGAAHPLVFGLLLLQAM